MQYNNTVKKLLKRLRSKRISVKEAYKILCDLPYTDLGFAKIDNHRSLRRGFPEVVYCKGKTPEHIEKILVALKKKDRTVLLTCADEKLYKRLLKNHGKLCFNKAAGMIYTGGRRPKTKKEILIVTGGTADLPVAEQARLTAELMGNKVSVLYDVGVAGLHRLLGNKRAIQSANVIIVIAGMEGALPSVVSGLVSKPIVAVPTSVGYGASFKGVAPLLTMLNSCSPGIGVVNIDNGFGAGYLASLINR
ncbi:MAG: nickel pincer cofactor biosynthesis protein LarB [Candidatus Omnitrophica bacterium]|nr:nickel pincer cofactor biosynthesis protein LarB [Candidatus Omnitrophota bacterium]